MDEQKLIATLLLTCPDRKGLVSLISNFIFERGGNIVDLVEHVNAEEQRFFLRVAWDMKEFNVGPERLMEAFLPMSKEFGAEWSIRLNRSRHKRFRMLFHVGSSDGRSKGSPNSFIFGFIPSCKSAGRQIRSLTRRF